MIRKDIILEDTTLRDGEQMPGVAFSKDTKLALHDLLVEAGIRWIDIGSPAMGGDELDFLKALLARGSDATLVAWNRGVRKDVETSIDMGFKAIHMGFPASDVLLSESVRKDRQWLITQVKDLVSFAKDKGVFVSISAGDSARIETEFLQEFALIAYEAGADRLRISDTTGAMTPETYFQKIAGITEVCGIDLQCHAHNDFGFALANTIAGLRAGARYFHVTVNGIGERGGFTDMAQTAIALKYLYERDVGIVGTKLPELCQAISEATGHPIPPHQPIVGENAFTHESGIHVNAMLRNPKTYEPVFSPEDVGGKRKYVLGKHSGRILLQHILNSKGIDVDKDELWECLNEVRALAVRQKGGVSEQQLLEIYRRLTSRSSG